MLYYQLHLEYLYQRHLAPRFHEPDLRLLYESPYAKEAHVYQNKRNCFFQE